MVKVKTKNTEKELLDFRLYNTFYKELYKTLVFAGILIALGAVLFILDTSNLTFFIVIIAMAILMLPAILLLTFTGTKSYVKKNPDYLAHEKTFEFFDEKFKILSVTDNKENMVDVNYDELKAAYFSKTALYLYIDNRQAFIVPKNCIIEGTEQELIQILKSKLNKKKLKGRKKYRTVE